MNPAHFSEEINMAGKVKAAVVTAFDRLLSIEEVAIPKFGRGQILMKAAVSGVAWSRRRLTVASS